VHAGIELKHCFLQRQTIIEGYRLHLKQYWRKSTVRNFREPSENTSRVPDTLTTGRGKSAVRQKATRRICVSGLGFCWRANWKQETIHGSGKLNFGGGKCG